MVPFKPSAGVNEGGGLAEEYLVKTYQAFERAAEAAGGSVDFYFQIAQHLICLRFAGRASAYPMTAALEHLSAKPAEEPSLVIHIWDSASSRKDLRPADWQRRPCGQPDATILHRGSKIILSYRVAEQIFSGLDCSKGIAFFHARNLENLPEWCLAAPLRDILHWWFSGHDLQMIHAAAVGGANGGVLLGGRGGAGKSTTALFCLEAGLQYLGDDYVLASTGVKPVVHSVYGSAKVNPDAARWIPTLAKIPGYGQLHSKCTVFPFEWRRHGMSSGFPLRAVLLPMVTRSALPRLRPVHAGLALSVLAPSTIFQLPGAGSRALSAIAHMLESLPAYVLELSEDLSAVPDLVLSLCSAT